MTGSRDIRGEMRNLLLDRDTAERLLAGRVDPDDAPPGYARVAAILSAASNIPPLDPARERATVAAMVEEVRAHLRSGAPATGRSTARGLVRAKIVAIGVGAMLVGTTGLAVAGALPDPAQRVVHTMFAKVGIEVPDSTGDGDSEGETTPTTPPAVPSNATHGQSGQPHGQSGQPHGQSGQPHGQSGQPNGQSGQPHGQAGQPHGQAGQPHGNNYSAHHGREGEGR